MPVKSKKQRQQEKRLRKNVLSAEANKKNLKQTPKPAPKKQSGIKASLFQRMFGTKNPPRTAQQSIPYREMYRDGICRVNDKLYTKTITFNDINYQLSQNEDKTQIFEGWCDFLNYFDSTISVQLSFVNQYGNKTDFEASIDIPDRDDDYNSIRVEYADMLKNQLAKGNNGLVKKKYITFGIEAGSLREAKPRLERIEADIIGNFKTLGVAAQPLNGLERLEVLHGVFHPDGKEKLRFSWKHLAETGMSTKDFIAPTSFDFNGGKAFRMGTTYGAVSHKEADILGTVFQAIKKEIATAADVQKLLDKLAKSSRHAETMTRLQEAIKSANMGIKRNLALKDRLFDAYGDDLITEQEYRQMKDDYAAEAERLTAEVARLEEDYENRQAVYSKNNERIIAFLKFKKSKALTKEMLTELVDKVIVHAPDSIEIVWQFADEYSAVCALAKGGEQ